MTSLQTRLETIANEIKAISSVIHHYKRNEVSAPFGVWAEQYEEDSNYSDNHKQDQGIHIQLDYYTQEEFDEVLDDLQDYFDANEYPWNLDSVLYEDDTNMIHYTWSFTVYGEDDSQGT